MDCSNVKDFMDYMAESHTPSNAISVYLHNKRVFYTIRDIAVLKPKL